MTGSWDEGVVKPRKHVMILDIHDLTMITEYPSSICYLAVVTSLSACNKSTNSHVRNVDGIFIYRNTTVI